MFKISASEFGTMGMHRRMRGMPGYIFARVPEGAVPGVYKVMTQSSFGVLW